MHVSDVAVAVSSCSGVAIRYLLPVLRMTSFFNIMAKHLRRRKKGVGLYTQCVFGEGIAQNFLSGFAYNPRVALGQLGVHPHQSRGKWGRGSTPHQSRSVAPAFTTEDLCTL